MLRNRVPRLILLQCYAYLLYDTRGSEDYVTVSLVALYRKVILLHSLPIEFIATCTILSYVIVLRISLRNGLSFPGFLAK